MTHRRAFAAVLVATLALVSVACSSGKKSGTAAGTSASTAAGSSASTAAGSTASTAKTPTGTPLKFYVIGPSPDDSKNDSSTGKMGVDAAVKEINDAGGVANHPLQAVFCGDGVGTNQNKIAECARNATGDPDVSAVVWATSNFGSSMDSVLEQAGMACVGCDAFTPADFSSKIYYTTTAGSLSVAGLAATAADVLHAKKIGLVIPDVATAHQIQPLIDGLVLKSRGLALDKVVYVPLDAVDLTAQAAQLSGEDAVINTLLQSNSPAFMTALRQQGSNAQVLVSGGVYGSSAIGKQFGDNANGVLAGSVFDHTSPGYAQYQAAAKAINQLGGALDSDQATEAYVAVQLFAQIATQLNGNVSRASVLSTISGMTAFDFKGITPAINFSVPGTFVGGSLPAIRNDAVTLQKYGGGKLTPQGSGFTHIFSKS